jgi:hypothetical protein
MCIRIRIGIEVEAAGHSSIGERLLDDLLANLF